jgi:hypothetical protein
VVEGGRHIVFRIYTTVIDSPTMGNDKVTLLRNMHPPVVEQFWGARSHEDMCPGLNTMFCNGDAGTGGTNVTAGTNMQGCDMSVTELDNIVMHVR